MTRKWYSHAWVAGGALLLVASLSGCVDEKIVYRDGPNFAAPPTAAASFLGYSDDVNKRTVCGSCHVTQQAKWRTTAHAGAWETLDKSGSAQGFCQACHTVNNLGNAVADTSAGWRTTKDKRYHDVQCESCHGPGLQHVQAPARGQMLPSLKPDTARNQTTGCAECHSGTHHPFTEDWRSSAHSKVYSGALTNASCQSCHIGQKALESWGVNTNYVEKAAGITAASALGTTCVVCHDPHGSANPAQLRFPVDERNLDNNLCMKCHFRRSVPDFNSSQQGPHSPQGPLLLGQAGWWPPGIEFDGDAVATHGSERNPRLCAGCHVNKFDVTDKATGKFVQTVTGHNFAAIPCVDANGLPTANQNCTVSQRSFKSCAASGCHTESSARNVYTGQKADIATLVNALTPMINDARVPAADKAAGRVSTWRGARFNQLLAQETGGESHNAVLIKALLRASIAQMAKDYGITPPIALPLLAPYDKLILGSNAAPIAGGTN